MKTNTASYRNINIFPNEIQYLQKKLDEFGINLHIYSMNFSYTKSSSKRQVKIIFRESYKNLQSNKREKKYVACISGVQFPMSMGYVYNEYIDYELYKVTRILINEYWFWLSYLDYRLYNFLQYDKKQNLLEKYGITKNYSKDILNAWKTYISKGVLFEECYPIDVMLNNYVSQIKRELIYDSPFGTIEKIPVDVFNNNFKTYYNIYDSVSNRDTYTTLFIN